MRLLPVLVLTTPLVAVAACGTRDNVQRSETVVDTQTVEPVRPSHITVSVSCRDTGNGIGAHIRPWRAHSGGGSEFVWNLVPANTAMPTELTPVNPAMWPFAQTSYTWSQGTLTVPIEEEAAEASYKYRLRIVCPAEADTIVPDTIVIDPLVIIDPSASADTTQDNSN